jgi:hypothetical protein
MYRQNIFYPIAKTKQIYPTVPTYLGWVVWGLLLVKSSWGRSSGSPLRGGCTDFSIHLPSLGCLRTAIVGSVVDPDPDPDPEGSETFCRIRIRIRNSRLWIRIRIRIRNWTLNLTTNNPKISNLLIMTLKIHYSNIFYEKFAFKSIKSHIKSLALWKSECLGSDLKLDPKLFTSRIRIRIRNYFFRIRIQNSAENGIQIRIRIRKK